jgi:DNA invertase Pin-like site-specific DNA recombinase/predicted nucleotidyltransferase
LIYGYARVSTDDQTLEQQVAALEAAGCATNNIFRDNVSGSRGERAQLAVLLETVGAGDVMVVTRLDRPARSIRDLHNILEALASHGAGFRCLAAAWADTTAPHGGVLVTMLGGLAEFERELIGARLRDGRARAKAKGEHIGRPLALTEHQRRRAICALRAGTATQAELAGEFRVSEATIWRMAEQADIPPLRARPALDADTERAARAFLRRLEGRYPVREAILYGSRARGTHAADSDADIAVILDGAPGDRSAAVMDMAGIAFHVMMETGVMVQALPLGPDELAQPESFNNPALIKIILREGIRL